MVRQSAAVAGRTTLEFDENMPPRLVSPKTTMTASTAINAGGNQKSCERRLGALDTVVQHARLDKPLLLDMTKRDENRHPVGCPR
jgi:hypothetical protein